MRLPTVVALFLMRDDRQRRLEGGDDNHDDTKKGIEN